MRRALLAWDVFIMVERGRECEDLLWSLALWLQDEVRWSGPVIRETFMTTSAQAGREEANKRVICMRALHVGEIAIITVINMQISREIFPVIFSKLILKTRHHHSTVQYCSITWVSDKFNNFANSFLSCPTTYWFFSKACSSLRSWLGEKAVRILFGFRKGKRNSGRWGPAERRGVY